MPTPNGMTPRYYGFASRNPNAYKIPNGNRMFAYNTVPKKANWHGLRLLWNNNRFTLTSSNRGAVGTTASASRAYNRGRASARNAEKLSYMVK